MGRFRFSMTTFLVVISLLAAGLAALVSQSRLGASAAYSFFLAILCLAVVGALVGGGDRRVFWLGFALFGWCYWFAEFKQPPNPQNPYVVYYGWYGTTQPTQPTGLITTEFLSFVEDKLSANRAVGSQVYAQWRGGGYYPGTITQADGSGSYLVAWSDGSAPQWTTSNFIQPGAPQVRVTGHAVMGSLWALLGGVLASMLFGGWLGRQPVEKSRADEPSAP
jgi:hypothetical protein